MVRTGVTAIHPRGPDGAADPVAAGFFSQNGNGEMTGVSWIEESGTLAARSPSPTPTRSGSPTRRSSPGPSGTTLTLADAWLLPVAAETWDGYLNDINGHYVTEQAAIDALESAVSGPIEEGSVGGGTGMNCYQFKGGSGTASRLVGYAGTTYSVGVFVQANFGSREELTITGLPVGQLLADDNPMEEYFALPAGAGSVIAIIATDALLLPQQCPRWPAASLSA